MPAMTEIISCQFDWMVAHGNSSCLVVQGLITAVKRTKTSIYKYHASIFWEFFYVT